MIAWFRSLWLSHVVAPTPPHLIACEDCREPRCEASRFAACERRLIMTELSKRQTEE